MDIPLHQMRTAPALPVVNNMQGAVTAVKQQNSQIHAAATIPAQGGGVGPVNEARISGQNPVLPDASEAERLLKPYGLTMLPRNETSDKLAHHTG